MLRIIGLKDQSLEAARTQAAVALSLLLEGDSLTQEQSTPLFPILGALETSGRLEEALRSLLIAHTPRGDLNVQLKEMLSHNDSTPQNAALRTISALGTGGENFLPEVKTALSSPQTQPNAIVALGNMGRAAHSTTDALLNFLPKHSSSDSELQGKTLHALSQIGQQDKKTQDTIVGLLSGTTSAKLLSDLAPALSQMHRDGLLGDHFESVLRTLSQLATHPDVSAEAITLLSAMGTEAHGDEIARVLMQIANDSTLDPQYRVRALTELGRLASAPFGVRSKVIPTLVDMAGNSDPLLQARAITALGKAKLEDDELSNVVAALNRNLSSTNEVLRLLSFSSLAKLKQWDSLRDHWEVLDALKDPQRQKTALNALESVPVTVLPGARYHQIYEDLKGIKNGPLAKTAKELGHRLLGGLSERPDRDELRRFLREDLDGDVAMILTSLQKPGLRDSGRSMLIAKLGRYFADDKTMSEGMRKSIKEAIEESIEHPGPLTREAALNAFVQAKGDGDLGLNYLMKHSRERPTEYRNRMLSILQGFGPKMLPKILVHGEHHSGGFMNTHEDVFRLGYEPYIGEWTPEKLEAILGMLDTTDVEGNKPYKWTAFQVMLGTHVRLDAAVPKLIEELKSGDINDKRQATMLLNQIGKSTPELAKALRIVDATGDTFLREVALPALGKLDPNSGDILLKALYDKDTAIRNSAIRGLGAFGPDSKTIAAYKALYARGDDNLKDLLLANLGNSGPEGLAIAIEALGHPAQRAKAVEALSGFGDLGIAKLLELSQSATGEEQTNAIFYLGWAKSDLPSITSTLIALAKTGNKEVRIAALYALGDKDIWDPDVVDCLNKASDDPETGSTALSALAKRGSESVYQFSRFESERKRHYGAIIFTSAATYGHDEVEDQTAFGDWLRREPTAAIRHELIDRISDPSILSELLQRETEPSIRSELVEKLVLNPNIAPTMQRLTSDPDQQIRELAHHYLVRHTAMPVDKLLPLLDSPIAYKKREAIEELPDWGQGAKVALPQLRRIREQDPRAIIQQAAEMSITLLE